MMASSGAVRNELVCVTVNEQSHFRIWKFAALRRAVCDYVTTAYRYEHE
jgi:hypothetical protein